MEKARHWRPQLIVVDLMLPDIDGWEVCRQLQLDAELRDTPIIMLTARPDRDGAERARKAGCDGYLTKPCLPDTLVADVVRVLGPPAERPDR